MKLLPNGPVFSNAQVFGLYSSSSMTLAPPCFYVSTGGVSSNVGVCGTAALPVRRWSHLAATYSSTTGFALYVDGELVANDTEAVGEMALSEGVI